MEKLKNYAQTLKRICENGNQGKKAVQKLMYLVERKGVDFELGYSIHYFGPYSAKLDDILHRLESDEIVNIDTSGRTHIVRVMDSSVCGGDGLSAEESEIVEYVVNQFGYKSAFELEGIATLDYIACNLPAGNISDKDIINGVKRIKGTKFSESQLEQYLGILKDHKYLA